MPNRYMGGQDGGDWWSQQDTGINTGPIQTQGGTAPGQTPTMPNVYGQISGGLSGQPGAGGPQGGNFQQWFMDLVGNRPWNQETFNQLAPTLQQYGFHITPPNAMGEQTKIQLPTGEWVRVGFGEGKPVWIPQGGAGGTNYGPAGPNPSGTGINSPWAIPPPFQSPSMEQFQQEPGLQALMAMGQQALERGAAAKGSILSGGFQKALQRYSQDYASNEYGNAYGRALGNYQQNFLTQSQTPWARYNDVANRGLTATLGTKTTPPISAG